MRSGSLTVILAGFTASALSGQTPSSTASADPSSLKVVAVDVQPAQAAPDTLCRLKVRIRNDGAEPASDLMFRVTVSSQLLAPYVNHVFTPDLPRGKETDVQLYNFWSSESGRPFPKDGRLVVSVQLTSARWRSKDGAGREVKPLPAAPTAIVVMPRKGP
jgi:hypothetical protein